MAASIEVSYHRFDPPPDLDERIRRLIAGFDRYDRLIVDGRVVVDATNRHGHKTVVEVAVELHLKGATVIGKRTAEYPSPAGQRTLVEATTEAFHVVQRQLKEHAAALRADVKTPAHGIGYGRIARIDRETGTGFVEMPDGVSLFFAEAVLKNARFESLLEGDTVMVTRADEDGTYGPQAASVEPTAAPEARIR